MHCDNRRFYWIVLLPSLLGFISKAEAQDIYIAPYVGAFEVLREGTTSLGGVEGRIGKTAQYVVPKVGLFITGDNARYFYTGFNLDFEYKQYAITPGLAMGAYSKGNGKNLGGTIEFYSSIEVGYRFEQNGHRLGVSLGHLSNAGIYKKNPGIEDLRLVYSIPMM